MSLLIDAESLARTYDHPSKDPWTAVQLYREATKRPDDWGSTRVASAINSSGSNEFEGISRGEVRAWVDDDSKPDAVRAIDMARDNGWLADEWNESTKALAKLVIGVYAFGSIGKDWYVPSWSPNDEQSRADIEDALMCLGVGYQHVRRDDASQADEIKPAEHASILGRALVIAGAPVGDKNADSVRELPSWVEDAPMVVKTALVLLFVRGRATEYPDKATRRVQADRGRDYFESWAQVIEAVTGEPATASDLSVTISAAAVRELGLA